MFHSGLGLGSPCYRGDWFFVAARAAVEFELGAAIKVYGLLLNKSALRIMLLKVRPRVAIKRQPSQAMTKPIQRKQWCS